jgi:hypothetical protein
MAFLEGYLPHPTRTNRTTQRRQLPAIAEGTDTVRNDAQLPQQEMKQTCRVHRSPMSHCMSCQRANRQDRPATKGSEARDPRKPTTLTSFAPHHLATSLPTISAIRIGSRLMSTWRAHVPVRFALLRTPPDRVAREPLPPLSIQHAAFSTCSRARCSEPPLPCPAPIPPAPTEIKKAPEVGECPTPRGPKFALFRPSCTRDSVSDFHPRLKHLFYLDIH